MNLDDKRRKVLDVFPCLDVPHTVPEQLKIIRKLQKKTLIMNIASDYLEKEVSEHKPLSHIDKILFQMIIDAVKITDADDILDNDEWVKKLNHYKKMSGY